MPPSLQNAMAAAHTAMNSPAMVKPALLMSKPATKSQNDPCRLSSSVIRPRISMVPIRKAAAIVWPPG